MTCALTLSSTSSRLLGVRLSVAVAVVLWAAAAGAARGAPSSDVEPPRLVAGALPDALRLDGVLDEAAWRAAPTVPDLVMVEPREGATPSFPTEVKVLAGPRAVVFGIHSHDPEPAKIVSFTRERDGDFEFEDHVVIVLDTFQDGRSGYVFAVNPGGARFDALIQPGGEDVDKSWDGEWEAVTRRDEGGWTAEIRVPISTLSFKGDLQAWGFNVQRRIQRLQETDRWASARQDYAVFQASQAGQLAGLPRFDLGLGLGIRPAIVGGFQNPAPAAATDGTLEPSLDVTKRLGTNVLASLTVNTDFAETEVDTRQTNLTRFPLFFPEKRTFFLDGADIFAFGLGIDGESLLPFFSRRIGLVEGQEVPILAGLKSTGRVGGTNFGALVVRTREEAGVAPAATMAVARAKQNVFAESRAGFIATAGDPLGRPGSWEVGADFTYQTSHFQGDKNFSAGLWGLATGRDDLSGYRERTAFGLKVDYPNDLWDCFVLYRRIGDGFDPSLGFVPRRGINTYLAGCTFAPRPERGFIRQMFHRLYPSLTTDLGGRWESYSVEATPLEWLLESGERVLLGLVPTGERLVVPFEIAPGVVIPPGSYGWLRYLVDVQTAGKRKLSGQATWQLGGFYGGTLHQLEVEASWTPSPFVTLLVDAEHSRSRLPEGDFDITLVGAKVRLNVSPNLQFDSFLQYDTEDRTFGTNTRLRWTFSPRGDFFLIYNHNLRELDDRWGRDSNELLAKVQYTFRP
jgi:Domain of unknown function (DUF5916)